jgi:hypothetical protein
MIRAGTPAQCRSGLIQWNASTKLASMSLSEIETAIKNLPRQELKQFDQWYQDYLEEQWDEQIRRDIRSGKLDALRSEVRRSEAEGLTR